MDTIFRAPGHTPICECGCGEPLKPGTKRRYKNGHKANPVEPQREVQPEHNWNIVDETGAEFRAWTYDDAAAASEPDPDPADFEAKAKKITIPDVKPRLHLTHEQQADIHAKIMFWLELGGAMLSPLDDVCVPVFAQQVPHIAAAMLPLVSQSPEVAAWFLKAGNFTLWANLAMAVWPVVSVIIAHHITKTKGSDRVEPNGYFVPADAYSTVVDGYAA